ncbi:MAG: LutB/LldF family L-lactate oxidation iron-sulfur protein [Desulfatirhabdiaceae bacterium]
MIIRTDQYVREAALGIRNPVLHRSLAGLQERLGKGALAAYQSLPEGPDLRYVAHDMRMSNICHLDVLLETLTDRIQEQGGQVFFASDAKAAVQYCIDVAARNDVRRVVKGKSMVSEEIGLNPALEAEGIEVTETDLGEYIVQLAHEHPSHIIAPAIHKTREDVGRLFSEKLGIPFTSDPPTLTRAARNALREKFLNADMGISGCNLACAQTGHITTLSNEGNIRMTSTLPRIHIAIMGMERVAATLDEHQVLLRLLSRGAAAQKMAGYVSYIGGPRQPGHMDGPDAFHLVILDNGRSRILADPEFREMLCCIRCGGCLNVCPVYARIGGHAYGYAYSGPVGAVVTPLLTGINRASDLCQGETLCGACRDVCPVHIDIPRMLLALRSKLADGDPIWNVKRKSRIEKASFMLWSWLVTHPGLYDMVLGLSASAQNHWLSSKMEKRMIPKLPGPLSGWTRSRDLRPLAKKRFVQTYCQGQPDESESPE